MGKGEVVIKGDKAPQPNKRRWRMSPTHFNVWSTWRQTWGLWGPSKGWVDFFKLHCLSMLMKSSNFLFSDVLPLDAWLNHVVAHWHLMSYWFKVRLLWSIRLVFWSHEQGPGWGQFCNPVPNPEQTLSKFLLNLRENRFKLLLNRILYPFSWHMVIMQIIL